MDRPICIQALLDQLKAIPAGQIEKVAYAKITRLLADCWRQLEGASDTSMTAEKLHRAKDLAWNPPCLSFLIERHGGTVLGSTRAELHQWTVNLDRQTAQCEEAGYRQLTPTVPRLNVRPVAARVRDAVQQGRTSNCQLANDGVLIWRGDDQVEVVHGKLIPGGGYQQTVAGRRRQFRNELVRLMKDIGWDFVGVARTMVFRKNRG
jgi:hypothetical protein